MVGEIYVRLDPFANNFLIDQLESRGLRVRLAPFVEWLEYTSQNRIQRRREGRHVATDNPLRSRITHFLEKGVLKRLYGLMSGTLEWPHRTTVENSLCAAAPYIDRKLMGEAVLTLGGPVHEYDCGHIDGVVSVGPHECMPNKIAEAQFAHVGDEKGLISLTLPLTGDPVDPEILDRFAFEVKEHHGAKV
jgi:predicted nucleotide-binding protein (sugar kinase/HSP70/actin superfamily)